MIVNIMNLILHISTEILILGLPLIFIRKLQISKTEKRNTAAVFLIAIITIILNVLRNASAVCGEDIYNNIVEITIILKAPLAILVCALPPYKILLAKFQKRNQAVLPQQNLPEDLRALPRRKPTRMIAVQDSITELEMP